MAVIEKEKDVYRVEFPEHGVVIEVSRVVATARATIGWVRVLDGGKELWRQKLAAVTLTAPLVAGGRVFALSGDRSVSAFDAASGRKLWQQQRTGEALVLGRSGIIMAIGDTLVAGLGGGLCVPVSFYCLCFCRRSRIFQSEEDEIVCNSYDDYSSGHISYASKFQLDFA